MIFAVALAWALFQFWYASPLPFTFGIGILNDTEARSLHLAFALFLAFTAWPAFGSSPRDRVPMVDWAFALAGAFAGAYLLLFYRELALRPGQPTTMDIAVAVTGIVLLLEATRRSVGWPMAVLALLFIAYAMGGAYLPEVLSHKGASVSRLMSHMWLTTEGVFGIALGVSTGTIFVYVLFGTLLDRAGGGNYMMQVSFAALGHLRGGPAKVAVVSSALNGLISGSSVSNVVSGRHLHHPADEEVRLRRRQGRRDRDDVVGQRPDHAAGDGRGRVPDGRVRRHPLLGDRQERDPAGHALVHRPLLHRAPRGAEARHAAADSSGAALVEGSADPHRSGHLRHDRRDGRAVLGARSGEARDGRRHAVGRRRDRGGALPLLGLGGVEEPRPAAGHRHRQPESAGNLAGGQGGPALRAADRHADLVPDGRGDVAVAVGVLGDRHADRADGDAAAADRFLPRHPDGPRVDEWPQRRPARASTTARAT